MTLDDFKQWTVFGTVFGFRTSNDRGFPQKYPGTPRFSPKIRSVLWFGVPLYSLYFTRSAKKFLVRVTYIFIVQHHWSIKIFTRVLQAYSTKLSCTPSVQYEVVVYSKYSTKLLCTPSVQYEVTCTPSVQYEVV